MKMTKRLLVIAMVILVALMCMQLTGCTEVTDTPVAAEHDLTRVAPKAATCTEAGNREYFTCSHCDEIFADAEGMMVLVNDSHIIPAKGHKVASHKEHSATCFSEGVKAYYECRNCAALFSDAEGKNSITAPEKLEKTSHSLIKVDAKQPQGFVAGWEEHYECSNCNKLYKDASATVETTLEAIKIAPTVTDFEYKIAFTPAASLENNGYITAKYVEDAQGLPATEFTIAAGAPSGTETYAWIHSVVSQTMGQGINLRVPTFSGQARKLELVVTNNGTETVSFRYYAENYGDKGGIDVTINPGETKTFIGEVNPGISIGCNYALKLISNVSTETKLVINGYFHCEGEVSSISLYKQASKTSFKVGEKFTTDGLVVKANGSSYDEVVISNFLTSIEEGYTFTASDVGTKTVTVAYGEYTVTYEITVTN